MHVKEQEGTFVVEKCKNACIASEQLKVVDMSEFLPAGSFYAGYLKAFNVEEAKGFFVTTGLLASISYSVHPCRSIRTFTVP